MRKGLLIAWTMAEPNLWEKVDRDRDFATFAKEIVAKNTEG